MWHRRLMGISGLACVGAAAEAVIIIVIAALAQAAAQPASETGTASGLLRGVSVAQLLVLGSVTLLVWMSVELMVARGQARLVSDYDAAQRFRLVEAFAESTWESQSRARRGEVVDLLATHLNQSRAGAAAFTTGLVSAAGILALQLGALLTGGWAALAMTGVLLVLGLALIPLGRWVRRSANALAAATPPMADRLTESLDLAREIKGFDVSSGSVRRVGESITPLRDALRQMLIAQRVGPAVTRSMLILVILVGLGAVVLSDAVDAGAYLATVLLLYRASQYGSQLHGAVQALQVASQFQARLDHEIQRMSADREPSGSLPVPRVASLLFDRVGFAYGGRAPVLSDATFSIRVGEVLGLSGRSGAGKSTIIDLILGLLRPTSGRILIDDLPLEEVSVSDWRQQVALVPQEGVLLNASVEENVRFFRDVHRSAVVSALRAANVIDEVLELPGGLDYQVGERGSRLSGGQRQRICIARALVADPALLVLDEPTSALDEHSQDAVRATVDGLRGRVTVVIAAHSERMLSMCDRVLEVTGGAVRQVRSAVEPPRVGSGP